MAGLDLHSRGRHALHAAREQQGDERDLGGGLGSHAATPRGLRPAGLLLIQVPSMCDFVLDPLGSVTLVASRSVMRIRAGLFGFDLTAKHRIRIWIRIRQ
jgi:hypothetical protein